GRCWTVVPNAGARGRGSRWNEDGIAGICDRHQYICFAIALWNGRDPILKERLFGVSGDEGNHGEDVKECYFYLDSTPTHSYMKALYKYPQRAFPYLKLVEESRRRSRLEPEPELLDTGIFDGDRYFDVPVEYGKQSPDDILIRITLVNCGREPARLTLLPTLWFRNTWSWGREGEGYWPRPSIVQVAPELLLAEHASLGRFRLAAEAAPHFLFTENETNRLRLFGATGGARYVKDAFHDYVIDWHVEAVN